MVIIIVTDPLSLSSLLAHSFLNGSITYRVPLKGEILDSSSPLLPTALASQVTQSPPSVSLSVCPFVYSLSFEPTDL